MKFSAGEMVLSDTTAELASNREDLNSTSTYLRAWHERVLYKTSTVSLPAGSIAYTPHNSAAYRASFAIEKVCGG